jgi:hypothetical protein
MTRVLHTYTDIRKKDQVETLAELGLIEAAYGDKLISAKCVEPDDYWSVLLRNWGQEDIVIIEQDVVARLAAIDELVTCQHKVCTFPYQLASASLSVFDFDYIKHIPFGVFDVRYPEHIPAFSDGTSLGFTKICGCLQTKIPLWEYDVNKYEWWYLDSFISWHLARLGFKVHVHQPLAKHNRTVTVTFNIDGQEITLTNEDEPETSIMEAYDD